jgi:hypothetical protein
MEIIILTNHLKNKSSAKVNIKTAAEEKRWLSFSILVSNLAWGHPILDLLFSSLLLRYEHRHRLPLTQTGLVTLTASKTLRVMYEENVAE